MIYATWPSSAFGATYGVANEECHTDGTLLTAGNWESSIEAAAPGKYRLPAGTLTPSGNIVVINEGTSEENRVVVVPDNCAAVTIAGQVQVGSYVTLAGVNVEAATIPGVITLRRKPTTGTTWAEAPIVRNVRMRQTSTGETLNAYGVRVAGNVRNHVITGSDLGSSNGGGVTFYQQNNISSAGTSVPENMTFSYNKCGNTGGDGCWQNGNVGTNTSGAMGGTANFIEGNWFSGITSQQSVDVKGMAAGDGGTLYIQNNLFDAASQAGACVLVHAGTPANSIVEIRGNVFNECNTNRAILLGGKYASGQLTEANWRVTIKENIFKNTGTGPEAILDELFLSTVERNVFLNGELRIQATIPSAITTVMDNTFHGTLISDARGSGGVVCQNNALFSTSGSFDTACTGGRTDDPQFVNTATLDFNSQQTTHVDAGTTNATYNGAARDIGLPDAPVPVSCVVADATPTKLHLTWQNNIYPPMTGFVNGSFTAEVDASPVTISTTVLQDGATNISEHTIPAVSNGEVVTIAGSYGAATDSANIGGPEVALNMKSKAFTAITCDNQVGAGAEAWLLSQTHYRTRRENNQIAVDTPINVSPGAKLLIEFQIDCTDDDCPPTAIKMRYDLDGGGYTALSNVRPFGVGNVGFVLTGNEYIPDNGTAIDTCLVATAGNDVPGAVQLVSAAVPNIDLAENDCAVNGYGIEFDTDATIGAVYSFCPVNEDGSELNGGCDAPAVVTIVDFGGVVATGRPQAVGRIQAAARPQAGARLQVVQ